MEKGLPVVSVLSVENNKTTTPAPTHTPVSASTPALSLSQQPASSVIQTEPQEGWVAAGGGGGGGGGGGVPPPINAQPVQPPAAGATGSPTDTSSSYHNHQHHQHHIIIAPSLFSPFSSPFSHHHSLDIPLPQAPASALLPPRTTSTTAEKRSTRTPERVCIPRSQVAPHTRSYYLKCFQHTRSTQIVNAIYQFTL